MSSTPSFAQSSGVFSEDERRRVLSLLTELEGARARLTALEGEVSALRAQVEIKDEIIAAKDVVVALLREANAARAQAGTLAAENQAQLRVDNAALAEKAASRAKQRNVMGLILGTLAVAGLVLAGASN